MAACRLVPFCAFFCLALSLFPSLFTFASLALKATVDSAAFFSAILAMSLANDSSRFNISERTTKKRTYRSVNDILLPAYFTQRNYSTWLAGRILFPGSVSGAVERSSQSAGVRARRAEPSEIPWPRASRCCTRAGRSVIASPWWAARHGTEEGAPQLQHRRRRERL